MKIQTFAPGGFGSNTYLCSEGGEAYVIDASVSLSDLLARSGFSGKILGVLLTHGHFDHIEALDTYADAGIPIYVGKRDGGMLSDPALNCYGLFFGEEKGFKGSYNPLSDGDILRLSSHPIRVYETPGHTPGSLCYRADGALFCGDLLFAGGSYGRYDLPGGDGTTLFTSIRALLETIDTDLVVYPGHGAAFSLNDEKQYF